MFERQGSDTLDVQTCRFLDVQTCRSRDVQQHAINPKNIYISNNYMTSKIQFGVSILSLSTIFLFYFRTLLTVWYIVGRVPKSNRKTKYTTLSEEF
jgi:hypothetical protein